MRPLAGITVITLEHAIATRTATGSYAVVFADIDLDLLRQYRKNEVWGDAYRKPYAYGALISGTTSEPFRRRDSRRVRPAP